MRLLKNPIALVAFIVLFVCFVGGWFLFTRDPYAFTFEEAFCVGCAVTAEEEAYIESVDDQEKAGMLTVSPQYKPYSPEGVKQASRERVVLFFKADWCPTCRLLDAHLRTSDIPEDVLILYVDFDTATELRQQYGVTVQHTLILLDRTGEAQKKWVGSRTLENVLSNL